MADSSDDSLMITPQDRDAIIRTTIGEAGNQPPLGQAAVAHVIMNRVIGTGSSPTAVVLAPNQFEANASGLPAISPSSPKYQAVGKIVDGVLSGDTPDPTSGATHFLNPDTVMQRYGRLPAWASGDGTMIGQHVFLGGNGQAPVGAAQDAPTAISNAAGGPPQAGQGSVTPGALAFTPTGLTSAVTGNRPPPSAPQASGSGSLPLAPLTVTRGGLPSNPPLPPARPPNMGGSASSQSATGSSAPSPAAMSDGDLETLLTGKPATSGPPAAAGNSAPAAAAPPNPATMSDADLEKLLVGGAKPAASPTGQQPAQPAQPPLTPAQLASGRDPQTGEVVVGGKPFTSDAGHWNGAVNFANAALQGGGTDLMAGVQALKAKLYDDSSLPLSDLYSQAKSTYQGGRQAYARANPGTAAATEIGGSLTTALPAMALGGAGVAATGNALADAARAVPILQRAAPAAEAAGNFVAGNADGLVRGAPLATNAANLLVRGGSLATKGAVQGAAGAAIASGLSDQPLANQVRQGAGLGAGAGVAIPAIAGAGRGAINRLLGAGSVSPETAALAQTARDSYGIPIRPGQITDSPGVRFMDSTLSRTPGMGYAADNNAQGSAFNRAVAGTMGEAVDRITPDVMSAARSRIGGVLNDVAANTTIRQDPPFVADLTRIGSEAHGVLAESELRPLQAQMQNVLSKFSPSGDMTGEAYQALTRTGSPLDRLQNSSDTNLRFYANQVRNTLDDALERSAPPDVLQQLQQARSQYKAMKTIEPLVEKSTTGDVSPAGLMQAVRGSYNGMAYGGGGPLGDLARIGQRFLKEPSSSGTAERLGIKDTIGTAGALGAAAMGANQLAPHLTPYLAPEAIPYTLASMAGSYGAGRLASSVLRSPTVSNMLINSALGTAAQPGPVNQLLSSVAARAPQAGVLAYNRLLEPRVPAPQMVGAR